MTQNSSKMADASEFEYYDLYLGVCLTAQRKNVLVPDYWCATFDLAKSINEGLNRNENHFIFFSADLKTKPDFSMEAWKGAFEPEVDRCYFGKVVRAFSKYRYSPKL